jgi:D-alanine transaminase
MPEIYLNGAFVAPEQAVVPVMDRGFLFGDGVYEVIPSYGGRFLGLREHLERLEDSLSAVRIANPLSPEKWTEVLERLIGPAAPADQYIYLQVTRGAPAVRDHLCPPGMAPTVLAYARAIQPRAPEVATAGVRCITRPDIRWQRCEIKAVSLLAAVMMRREAEDEGAMEAILVRDGMVTEGSSTNVFVVRDGEVLTPPRGHLILPGITRELTLRLTRDLGLRAHERRIPLEELQGADEIWITSSTREVLPVSRLDGEPVGAGVPGPLWGRVDAAYQAFKSEVRLGRA